MAFWLLHQLASRAASLAGAAETATMTAMKQARVLKRARRVMLG